MAQLLSIPVQRASSSIISLSHHGGGLTVPHTHTRHSRGTPTGLTAHRDVSASVCIWRVPQSTCQRPSPLSGVLLEGWQRPEVGPGARSLLPRSHRHAWLQVTKQQSSPGTDTSKTKSRQKLSLFIKDLGCFVTAVEKEPS